MEPEKVSPSLGIIKQSVTTIKKRGENGTSILFHLLGVCVKQNNLIGTPFNRYLSFTHTFTAFGSRKLSQVWLNRRGEEPSICAKLVALRESITNYHIIAAALICIQNTFLEKHIKYVQM